MRRTLSQNGMCASTASQQDSARASGPACRPIFSQLPSPFSSGAFTPCKAAALLQDLAKEDVVVGQNNTRAV